MLQQNANKVELPGIFFSIPFIKMMLTRAILKMLFHWKDIFDVLEVLHL